MSPLNCPVTGRAFPRCRAAAGEGELRRIGPLPRRRGKRGASLGRARGLGSALAGTAAGRGALGQPARSCVEAERAASLVVRGGLEPCGVSCASVPFQGLQGCPDSRLFPLSVSSS